jgi:hypothetical protein
MQIAESNNSKRNTSGVKGPSKRLYQSVDDAIREYQE